jgi:hypothetical protein
MIFSVVVILMVAAVTYWHYVQGMFSATISVICAILAAVLAFSYHEAVVSSMLRGRVADQAHAMVIVSMFVGIYLIMRLILDTAVPGNIRLPAIVDKIGGAALGLIVGLCGMGIVAIAAQELPFGPSVAGYVRYRTTDQRDVKLPTRGQAIDTSTHDELTDDRTSVATPGFAPGDSRGLILPADDFVIGMTSYLSEGSLSAGHPLKVVHPAFLDELFGQRLGVQIGASHVAVNLQESVHVTNSYIVDALSQADEEIIGIRPSRQLPDAIKSDPQHAILILRTVVPASAADADHIFRFSPASINLISNSVAYIPIGTLDDTGLLRNDKPDDFLFIDINSAAPIDLVFYVDQGDVFDTTGKDKKFLRGAFLVIKRMATADLSEATLTDRWTPSGKKGVFRKPGLAAPKPPVILAGGAAPQAVAPPVPGAQPAPGAAPPAAPQAAPEAAPAPSNAPGGPPAFIPPPPPPPPPAATPAPSNTPGAPPNFVPPPPPPPPPGANAQPGEAPFKFEQVVVADELPSTINIGPHEDNGEATFAAGTAKMKGNHFAKLTVNGSQTLALMSRGDYAVKAIYVPQGMKLVQLKGITGSEPWQWAEELSAFTLMDSGKRPYPPYGGWAKIKQSQQDYFVAEYDAATPVRSIARAEGRPTEVWIAFQVPLNTTLASLSFKGQEIATVDQTVQ